MGKRNRSSSESSDEERSSRKLLKHLKKKVKRLEKRDHRDSRSQSLVSSRNRDDRSPNLARVDSSSPLCWSQAQEKREGWKPHFCKTTHTQNPQRNTTHRHQPRNSDLFKVDSSSPLCWSQAQEKREGWKPHFCKTTHTQNPQRNTTHRHQPRNSDLFKFFRGRTPGLIAWASRSLSPTTSQPAVRSLEGSAANPSGDQAPEAGPDSGPPRQEDTLIIHNDDELSPNLLGVLGEDPAKENSPTSTIHHAVATRWNYLIAKGLSGDESSNLEDSYPLPSNVELVTPEINPEILSFLSGTQKAKDGYHAAYHRQVATSMAALGKGMDVLFQSNLEGQMKEVILKYLNDAGRCLASLSHNITHNRRKMLIPLLSKTVKEVADKTTPTKLLFGDNLRENIKTAKLLENEGKELKATYSTTPKKMYTLKKRGGAPTHTTEASSSFQGNQNRPAHRHAQVREMWHQRGRPSHRRYQAGKEKYNRRK
nr:unnamed protein product [Callosobruchus chinensis]